MNQDLFNIMANCLQVYNTVLLEKDASNNDVMKALQEQNNIYFERIIKQLEDIKLSLTVKKSNYAVDECIDWLQGMLSMMHNEQGDYNKHLPIYNFEDKMRELLIKLQGVRNE